MSVEFAPMLSELVAQQGSDLFLSVGAPPMIKVEGRMQALEGAAALSSQDAHQLCYAMLTDEQRKTFESTMELNMALRMKNIGRFRINMFRQQAEPALVARHIKSDIPSLDSLGLPVKLSELIMEERGLILLVGGTGTGKSTTLASMIDYRNSHRFGHILTIEDPVEFVHKHKQSLVNQRDVGLDTHSYEVALKNAMREAPDVIMIGEIRDQETMRQALTYAETGHLCLSTLHANNAKQAYQRILNFFPESAHQQVLQDFSTHLKAVVSQRLAIGRDSKRVAAVELMLNTPYISELLRDGQIDKLNDAMVQGRESGCQLFEDALFTLVRAKRISKNEALRHADSKTNLDLRFKLEGVSSDETAPPIKSDVAFARSAPFDNYQTFTLKQMKVTNWPEQMNHIISMLETGVRAALVSKGLKEVTTAPDLLLQYVLGTKQVELALEAIDNPVQANAEIHSDISKRGILCLNLVDQQSGKAVWRVTASRKLIERELDQESANADCLELFAQYPPL
jgi:twitching motility protein PilU